MVAFGTSGLRGLATELLAGPGYRHAAAFAAYSARQGVSSGTEVAIGMDRRDSSPALAGQAIHAVRAAGLRPVFFGVIPTPALALHAMTLAIPSIMVTGSHIPPDRNGLKFYRPDGEIDKADEAAIAALAAASSDPAEVPTEPLPAADAAAGQRYLERYQRFFGKGMLSGWRIGVWRHSSVAADVVVELLTYFGAEVIELGASGEFVAVDTEAIDPDTAERLKAWRDTHQLDAIVSTDGDGDRPLLVDDRGAVVRGDALGLLVARYLGADVIVTPVSSNPGITSKYGFEVLRTRIGSPYVIAGMAEALERGGRRVVGFEANGGVLLGSEVRGDHASLSALPTRDSVLPLLSALAMAGPARSVSRLVDGLGLPACASGRVENFPRSQADRLLGWLARSPENMRTFLSGEGDVVRVETIDGTQIHLDNGAMIHLRPSGNAPEMRCYVSAGDAARAEALLAFGLKQIREFANFVEEA